MNLFRRVVYSSNEVNCVAEKEKLVKDDIFQKYTNFQEYFRKLWIRNREWCLCFCSTQITRGNNTNNIVEASIRIFKDVVLERCKAFNMYALHA